MAKLSTIWVWPGMGFADQYWSGRQPGNADENAFYRTSVRVCEVLSKEIAQEGIQARSSEVRLFGELGDGPDLMVNVIEGVREGFECAWLTIPKGVHQLPSEHRAELVASAVEVAVDRLAELHDWDRQKIKDAIARARESSFELAWTSGWKASKDRRWSVRLVGQIMDDGYARIRVEQKNTADGSTRLSGPIRGGTSRRSLARAAKSMRWEDGETIAFHNGALIGDAAIGRLTVPSAELRSDPALLEPLQNDPGSAAGEPAMPLVRLMAAPEFQWFGGWGPTDGRTAHYEMELLTLHSDLEGDAAWREWWTLTGVSEVNTPVWFNTDGFRMHVKRTGSRLTATRYRAADTIPDDEQAARELARSDFGALIQRVRARFDLPDPPSLA